MILFILRRLGWAAVTIFGVMIITFVLFRGFAGDIAGAHLGSKAPENEKAQWRHSHGYDLPWIINVHRRLETVDNTFGPRPFNAEEPRGSGSNVASALALIREVEQRAASRQPADEEESPPPEPQTPASEPASQAAPVKPADWKAPRLVGRYVWNLKADTKIDELTKGAALIDPSSYRPRKAPAGPAGPAPVVVFGLSDGSSLKVDFTGAKTAGDVVDRINLSPDNGGRLVAVISRYSLGDLPHSQFFLHLSNSVTFQARSLVDDRKLTEIIGQKGPYSLAITVPALAFEFLLGLTIACFVAYYRGTRLDKTGVFLSVLGMCVPFLAFMIYGQWLVFLIAPRNAYGIFYRGNIYLPVGIMVLASLGGMVRFYRTVILDETNRDYVRTAKAKGLPLPTILFKHVLRNCMLPILTNVIMTIPFLIMGSLLVESFFGIPGLGDLMLTSIFNRNEPIMSGMVFLTALVYTLGVLLTDLSYALFDPRIRLG